VYSPVATRKGKTGGGTGLAPDQSWTCTRRRFPSSSKRSIGRSFVGNLVVDGGFYGANLDCRPRDWVKTPAFPRASAGASRPKGARSGPGRITSTGDKKGVRGGAGPVRDRCRGGHRAVEATSLPVGVKTNRAADGIASALSRTWGRRGQHGTTGPRVGGAGTSHAGPPRGTPGEPHIQGGPETGPLRGNHLVELRRLQ